MNSALPSLVPIPPVDAEVKQICCEYCPVACGYKVLMWPVGSQGGTTAADNALSVDLPTSPLSGRWVSENMHTVVDIKGVATNVIIMPDYETEAVNLGGTHSVRGGALAQKLYRADGPTSDRFKTPLLKVNGDHVPISWEMATDLVAALSTYTIETWDELAWGVKIYSYQFYENVFAASKLGLGMIGTPNYSPHHAPAEGDDVPGLSDCGIDAFGSSFADDKEADVIFISGSDPYETKTVRFTTWQVAGGAKIIYVDPRRTFTANYAENNGGIHLQIKPGTDVVLYSALVKYIIDQGWQDTEFIDAYIASTDEVAAEGKWRRARFGRSFDGLRADLDAQPAFELDRASEITGVPVEKLIRAAELMTGGGFDRPKTMVLFEKGVYWSHNYENTAAIGNLGLVLGATGRPGRATGRMGGHQRGGQKAAGYPKDKSPHFFETPEQKVEMDTERWLYEGNTRFRWIIGTNWIGAMGASQDMRRRVNELISIGDPVDTVEYERTLAQLKDRMDKGGTVIVHQEAYANGSTGVADIILPAATWGEDDFTRNNAERRLRLYEKIMDPPGDAKPDWQIFAAVAKKMGFEGFDWKDTNEIFEEAAPKSAGGRRNFEELVKKAQADGMRGHDLLKTYGTTGIQTPIKNEGGELVGTERLHADLKFKTDSKKANFVFPDWESVDERNAILKPLDGQVWVLNGRVNALWNNLSDNVRRELSTERWPANFLEVSPEDAQAWGVESGDLLSITSQNVLSPVGERVTGSFSAVAYVSDIVPPGVTFSYMNFPGSETNAITSADTSLQPLSLRNNFKLGAGTVEKIGTTDLKETMSFAPRNLAP